MQQTILDPFGMFTSSPVATEVFNTPEENKTNDQNTVFEVCQPELEEKNVNDKDPDICEEPLKVEEETQEAAKEEKELVSTEKSEVVEDKEEEKSDTPVVEPVESTEEEKPQKTKTRKTKTPKASKKEAEYEDLEFTNIKTDIPNVDIDKVIKKFFTFSDDDEWNNYCNEINDEIDKIRLDSDINLGTLKILLPITSNVYSRVRPLRGQLEAFLKTFENFISRQQALNAIGANPEARKKRGYESCENFSFGNLKGEDNLYDVEIIFRHRYETVKAWLDVLENKRNTMVSLINVFSKKGND